MSAHLLTPDVSPGYRAAEEAEAHPRRDFGPGYCGDPDQRTPEREELACDLLREWVRLAETLAQATVADRGPHFRHWVTRLMEAADATNDFLELGQ